MLFMFFMVKTGGGMSLRASAPLRENNGGMSLGALGVLAVTKKTTPRAMRGAVVRTRGVRLASSGLVIR